MTFSFECHARNTIILMWQILYKLQTVVIHQLAWFLKRTLTRTLVIGIKYYHRRVHRHSLYIVTACTSSQLVRRHSLYVVTACTSSQLVRRHSLYVVTACTSLQLVRRHSLYVITACTSPQLVRRHSLYVVTACTSSQLVRRHSCVHRRNHLYVHDWALYKWTHSAQRLLLFTLLHKTWMFRPIWCSELHLVPRTFWHP